MKRHAATEYFYQLLCFYLSNKQHNLYYEIGATNFLFRANFTVVIEQSLKQTKMPLLNGYIKFVIINRHVGNFLYLYDLSQSYSSGIFQQNLRCNTENTFFFFSYKQNVRLIESDKLKRYPNDQSFFGLEEIRILVNISICDNNIPKTNSRAITIRRAVNPRC